MDRSRRRLTVTVGTSLLTATLSAGAAGCAKKQTVNVHPDEVAEPTTNEGPVADPEPEVPPDAVVNEGPVDDGEGEGEGEDAADEAE